MENNFSNSQKPSLSLYYEKEIIDTFASNPQAPFLVSFPRTGSHWLRMLMELYFERPLLTRIFFYHDKRDFLALHTHDLELDIKRMNVIYLYRDPVDTIYSQLKYHNEDSGNNDRISYWADLYGRHLEKWLTKENFTKAKTIIRFENLKKNITDEFRKICSHFDTQLNYDKLCQCIARVSKEGIQNCVPDDPKVVDLSSNYSEKRDEFRIRKRSIVMEAVLRERKSVKKFFV